MDRLIAEDLLLLLLDDEKGTAGGVDLDVALGGALLIELAVAGAVEVGERSGLLHQAKVRVVPGVGVTDPVLVDSLGRVAAKERRAQDLVGRLGKGRRDELAARLAAAGILKRREGSVLGVFDRTTWPTRNPAHEEALRRQLTAVVVSGQPPDVRTAALVALLTAVERIAKVVPHEGLSGREVKKRATAVSARLTEGGWAAQAVSDAVAAASAAAVSASVAAVTAATAGSGS